MTLTVELTPDGEARLYQAAQRAGLKPEELARRLIEEMPVPQEAEPKARTGREVLASWRSRGLLGKVYADRAEDSGEIALQIRQEAQTRHAD